MQILLRIAPLLLWATSDGLSASQPPAGASNIVLWDTSSPLADTSNVEDRSGWKPVPSDLLSLEADPARARSDPGYYGREYSFTGDAVVENRSLTAVFWSTKGQVVIGLKRDATSPTDAWPQTQPLGRKIAAFVPLQQAERTTIRRVEVLRHADDAVALDVSFSVPGAADISAVFTFDKTEIVEIRPSGQMKGVRLLSPITYGVVPSFIGDDLIFAPAGYPSANTLCLPTENLFLGLLEGEGHVLVMTWPKARQKMRLQLRDEPSGGRRVESLDFDNDGQSLYVAALGAPGIWHQEVLTSAYLEKDLAIPWKAPFPAKWKTQLDEAGVRTTFAFGKSKGQIWRGVAGMYRYPVWFEGDTAHYHLSKKVPPQGESLIYFLEGRDTPPSISTPVDILKATLGRSVSDDILDLAGRKLRTHHRRGAAGVRRACTCGCTEAIQAVFEAGEEVEKQANVEEAVDDMIYFVRRHVERIDEYQRFADDLISLLAAKDRSAPALQPFLGSLAEIVRQIPQECRVQADNMKSLSYVDELARRTLALAARQDPNNLTAYMALSEAWRAMGGAQDYVLAQCHTLTRRLHQAAGYGCVSLPGAVEIAEDIRARCRQCLRNPDGYEIWADY